MHPARLSLRALGSQKGVAAFRRGRDLWLKNPSHQSQPWPRWCYRPAEPELEAQLPAPAGLCLRPRGAHSPTLPRAACARPPPQESQASSGRKVSHSISAKMDPGYLTRFTIKKKKKTTTTTHTHKTNTHLVKYATKYTFNTA